MDYIDILSYSVSQSAVDFKYVFLAMVIAMTEMLVLQFAVRSERITGVQISSVILLTFYLFLVFSSTIFSRLPGEAYKYELEIFWSYRMAFGNQTDRYLLVENFLNILMLMPEGLLLPFCSRRGGRLETLRWVVFIGFLTCACIETVQLVTKRGLFEFDDMIHNTLGVLIGYGIYRLIRLASEKLPFRQEKSG